MFGMEHVLRPTRLHLARLDRGLALDTLADAAEVSADYLARLERGAASPSARVAKLLSIALGSTPEEFFYEEATAETSCAATLEGRHRVDSGATR